MARPAGGAGGKFVKRTGDWKQVRDMLLRVRGKLGPAIRKAMLTEAQIFRAFIVKGFTQQAAGGVLFRPLSPVTLALRKAGGFSGSKALIRTGTLRASVTVVEEHGGVIFVGVHRKSAGRVNIAEMQEFGGMIRMSPKQRRFIFANIRKAGLPPLSVGANNARGPYGWIVIPPRPFIRPWFNEYTRHADLAKVRIMMNIAKHAGLKGPKL